MPLLLEELTVQREAGPLPPGGWNKPPDKVAMVPIKQQGQDKPAGFFVVGVNPYRRDDAAYGGFVDLLAGQIAAGIGNARAYEAERKRAEALAEIDRAKITFFSNVSHELRTPLTLMCGRRGTETGRAPATPTGPPQWSATAETRERPAGFFPHRSRPYMREFRPVDLSRLTIDLASNFRAAMERSGLEFNIHCESLGEPVLVDAEMWEKIVLNLLSNALKFTFTGSVTVELKRSRTHAVLTVRDTGVGIPEGELTHIFERFHRVEGSAGRTIEGTGIGLALVQELVKLLAGSIHVSSKPNQGSTFTVEIPGGAGHLQNDAINAPVRASSRGRAEVFIDEALRWLPEAHANDGMPDGRDSSGGRKQILLADDNADMRGYVSRLLGEQYQVVAVSDGAEAIERALAHPPDLIL